VVVFSVLLFYIPDGLTGDLLAFKMIAKLSIKFVKTLQPKDKPYEVVDTDIKGFLLRVQPSGIMTYYLSYRTHSGNKKRYKIGRHGNITTTQARDIANKSSAQVISGSDIQCDKKAKRLSAKQDKLSTLKNFLQTKYEPWVLAERKSGKDTMIKLNHSFSTFMEHSLKDITHFKIEQWRVEQKNIGKKAITLNRNIAALKAALSKAVEWDIISDHPLKKLKMLRPDFSGKFKFLSDEEEKRLRFAMIAREKELREQRKSANQWRETRGYPLFPDLSNIHFVDYLQPMILLSINTGMRRGELFSLCWEYIDINRAMLTVDGSTSKNAKTRHIPLNKEALFVLKCWMGNTKEGLVFPAKSGTKLNNVRKSWLTLLKKAQIEKFRWHDMRHHFASRLVMAGVDLNTVRELLGHSDIKMTLRYAHLAPEHKAKAVAKLERHYAYA